MTPEEKFNRDVWWTLQAIKREQLSTPEGGNIEINIADLTNIDADSPATDSVSKCIRKLEERGAFNVLEKYDPYDPYYGSNPNWDRATGFLLTINQLKFDKIYQSFESRLKKLKKDAKKEITPPSPRTSSFDWKKLSPENLIIAQRVIKVTLNFLQFQPVINRLSLDIRIPLQKFENEQVYLDDINGVLNRIDGIKVINTKLLHEIKEYRQTRVRFPSGVFDKDELPDYLPSEEELKNYVFLEINSLDELHRVQNLIDEKLKIDTKTDKEVQFQLNKHLTAADKKKLCVLEKLKEEWDLAPKKNNEIIETDVSWQKLIQWEEECGVDYYQFKNILQGFLDENLIVSFNLYNPAV